MREREKMRENLKQFHREGDSEERERVGVVPKIAGDVLYRGGITERVSVIFVLKFST